MENALIKREASSVTCVDPRKEFGEYIKKSRLCPICSRPDHMEINAMRAVDHMPFDDISSAKKVAKDSLDLHFRKHFRVSDKSQQIINLKENDSRESDEIVAKILEGDLDLFDGAMAVMKSKIMRLHIMQERLKDLADRQEIDALEDIEKQEFILLSREVGNIENDIIKIQQIIDKKMFPASKEELSNAILKFKLNVLEKFVDDIITVFIEYEKVPGYTELVQALRHALVPRIKNIESSILKSGGIIESPKPIIVNNEEEQNTL